jgi:hypothetical protein
VAEGRDDGVVVGGILVGGDQPRGPAAQAALDALDRVEGTPLQALADQDAPHQPAVGVEGDVVVLVAPEEAPVGVLVTVLLLLAVVRGVDAGEALGLTEDIVAMLRITIRLD